MVFRILILLGMLGLRVDYATPQESRVTVQGETRTVGSFKIRGDNKPIGWERFELSENAAGSVIKSDGETTGPDELHRISTTTSLVKGKVSRYTVETLERGKTKKYDIGFDSGTAKVHIEVGGRTADRTIKVNRDVVILDRDVWHQYGLLLSRYNMVRQGRQTFYVLSPLAALQEMVVDVQFDRATNFGSGSSKQPANKFLIVLAGGFEVTVLADQKGFPLSIEIPALNQKVLLE